MTSPLGDWFLEEPLKEVVRCVAYDPSGEWRQFESGGLEATHKHDLQTADLLPSWGIRPERTRVRESLHKNFYAVPLSRPMLRNRVFVGQKLRKTLVLRAPAISATRYG